MSTIKHFVDGKIDGGSSKRTANVFNPATGEQTSKVNLASKIDVDLAVEKAKKAFDEWSNKPPVIRARVLFKFKELIEKNSDYLTKLIVSEHGKGQDDRRARGRGSGLSRAQHPKAGPARDPAAAAGRARRAHRRARERRPLAVQAGLRAGRAQVLGEQRGAHHEPRVPRRQDPGGEPGGR